MQTFFLFAKTSFHCWWLLCSAVVVGRIGVCVCVLFARSSRLFTEQNKRKWKLVSPFNIFFIKSNIRSFPLTFNSSAFVCLHFQWEVGNNKERTPSDVEESRNVKKVHIQNFASKWNASSCRKFFMFFLPLTFRQRNRNYTCHSIRDSFVLSTDFCRWYINISSKRLCCVRTHSTALVLGTLEALVGFCV